MEELTAPEQYTAWVEVDREALAHNLRQVRGFVAPEVKVLAVVKADAYGHGAVEASRTFVAAGADFLGVTRLEEALELRHAGIEAPILVFGTAIPAQARTIVTHRLSQTVCTLEAAQALAAAGEALGVAAAVHVKFDSGMHRLGVRPADAVAFVRALRALPGLEVQGIYTHFATSIEPDASFFRRQLSLFLRAVSEIEKAGLGRPIVHAANSGGILRGDAAHLDMVRPGTILYGQYPSAHVPRPLELRPTWQLKARVAFVQGVGRGESIGYGRDFTAPRDMTVATIPFGWFDGLTLAPVRTARTPAELLRVLREFLRRGRAGVRIHGQHAPFVGRVAMQMCSVDVSHIPGVQPGDEVLLHALRTLTNPRIPRVYR